MNVAIELNNLGLAVLGQGGSGHYYEALKILKESVLLAARKQQQHRHQHQQHQQETAVHHHVEASRLSALKSRSGTNDTSIPPGHETQILKKFQEQYHEIVLSMQRQRQQEQQRTTNQNTSVANIKKIMTDLSIPNNKHPSQEAEASFLYKNAVVFSDSTTWTNQHDEPGLTQSSINIHAQQDQPQYTQQDQLQDSQLEPQRLPVNSIMAGILYNTALAMHLVSFHLPKSESLKLLVKVLRLYEMAYNILHNEFETLAAMHNNNNDNSNNNFTSNSVHIKSLHARMMMGILNNCGCIHYHDKNILQNDHDDQLSREFFERLQAVLLYETIPLSSSLSISPFPTNVANKCLIPDDDYQHFFLSSCIILYNPPMIASSA